MTTEMKPQGYYTDKIFTPADMDKAIAKERERLARFSQTLPNPYKHCQVSSHAYDMAILEYSRAIRARGEA